VELRFGHTVENLFKNGLSMNRILAEVPQTGVLFLQVRTKFSIKKNQMRSSKVSWHIDTIRSFVKGPCFSVSRKLEAVWASIGVICPEKYYGEGDKWEFNANKSGPEV